MDKYNEIEGVMKNPAAKGEMRMGGVKKPATSHCGGGLDGNMSAAIKCLNWQSGRKKSE